MCIPNTTPSVNGSNPTDLGSAGARWRGLHAFKSAARPHDMAQKVFIRGVPWLRVKPTDSPCKSLQIMGPAQWADSSLRRRS